VKFDGGFAHFDIQRFQTSKVYGSLYRMNFQIESEGTEVIPHSEQFKKNLLMLASITSVTLLVCAAMFSKDRVPDPRSWALSQADQSDIDSVARQIDQVFLKRWQSAGVEPASPADRFTIFRRISLGLTGSIASLEEIRRIEQISEPQQIDWWIARLLEDRRTSDHLAERFARAFVGVENGPFIVFRRHRFVSWLAEQFHARRPYDELVRQMVSSTGLWTDSPGTNFISISAQADMDNRLDPITLTAKTSRALLGVRLDCLECHNDFLGNVTLGEPGDAREGQQIDFHQLAAFFGQVNMKFAGVQDRPDADTYKVRLLEDSQPREVTARVPYADHLLPTSGLLRDRLAKWITHPENKPFARVTVNRLWAVMFGAPIVETIDDISLVQPLPEELEILANDLIANRFDLYRTLRVMVASRVFRLDSRLEYRLDQQSTDMHEQLRAVYPLVRLRPEQMARSILQATALRTIDYSAGIVNRVISFGTQTEFVDRYGDFGKDEFILRSETVTQRLLMLNGQMLRDRINNDLLAPNQVAWLATSDERLAKVIYLTCLTRYPTADETAWVSQRLSQSGQQSRRQVVTDLYWAILNSAEFGWSH
jgi:hypothetical protein